MPFDTFLRENLRQGGVDDTHVATLAGRASGMSVAISDYGAVIVSGTNLEIDPASLNDDGLWAGIAMLVLQNEVSEEMNLAAAQAARAHGVQVCRNAAPYRPFSSEMTAAIDILVVNALEAEALSGVTVGDIPGARDAAHELSRTFPMAVVTAGGDGVAVAEHDGEHFALPAEKVTLVSTHEAGDVFTGFLATALVSGVSLAGAARQPTEPPPSMLLD